MMIDLPPGIAVLGLTKEQAVAVSGLTERQFNKAVKKGRLPPPLDGTQTWLFEAMRRRMAKWAGLEPDDERQGWEL